MAIKDLSGMNFGILTVISRAGSNKGGSALWKCICKCGEERIIEGTGLRAGRNKSCGCASPRFTKERVIKHGMSSSRCYRIWRGMITRCSEKSSGKSRRNYYLKGITVCERWMRFENFFEDMGIPNDGFSLDRIDGTKGYSPENCRWATIKQQANNTISNRIIRFKGKCATVSEWAANIGMKSNTLEYRLLRGWSIEDALLKPIQKRCQFRAVECVPQVRVGCAGRDA